jgi:hypothetical protein
MSICISPLEFSSFARIIRLLNFLQPRYITSNLSEILRVDHHPIFNVTELNENRYPETVGQKVRYAVPSRTSIPPTPRPLSDIRNT